jgi:hypothetical protein
MDKVLGEAAWFGVLFAQLADQFKGGKTGQIGSVFAARLMP